MRKFFMAGSLMLMAVVSAQGEFKFHESSTEMMESGRMDICTILTGEHTFNFISPRNFLIKVDEPLNKITLTLPDRAVIWIEVTKNFPGGLPDEAALKKNVLQRYVGAGIFRSQMAPSGSRPGWLIDVKRFLSAEKSLMTRHVFIPIPGGTVEFICSTDSELFDRYRNIFANLVNSFQVETAAEPLARK